MNHISCYIQNPRKQTITLSDHKIFDKKSDSATKNYAEFQDSSLKQTYNRYDLLLLVKKSGKRAGFSAKMIELLDYYMAFTRDVDWEEGARPIIYQSLAKTALDLGVSERHIQRLEKQLFEAGALRWNHSGNHRRYGQRHAKTGRILYGFGVDLSPLACLKPTLETFLIDKKQQDHLWMETKRQISWYRRQILSAFHEDNQPLQYRYKELAKPIRTYMTINQLQVLLVKHQELLKQLKENQPTKMDSESKKESRADDKNVVLIESTNQIPSDKSETEDSEGMMTGGGSTVFGIEHVRIQHVMAILSTEQRLYLRQKEAAANWHDLAEWAFRFKDSLKISHNLWGRACHALGRSNAIVCLILTGHAAKRESGSQINTAAYFNALITRGIEGRLELHKSIFNLLKHAQKNDCFMAA